MWGRIDSDLARVPLSLSWALSGQPSFWIGAVECEVPIVGVTLAFQDGSLEWTRSRKLAAGTYVVGEPPVGFPISFWIGRAREEAGPRRANVALYLRGAARATMVGEFGATTSFEILERAEGRTGEAIRLVRLGTTPPAECGFLFLAQSDVRYGRKGLWRLRPQLRASVSGVFAEILTSSTRSGAGTH